MLTLTDRAVGDATHRTVEPRFDPPEKDFLMICLHRLRGDELWVNPDLIVFAERNGHDTVVTLADGNRVTVCEPVQEIASAVMQFRSSVLAAAENLSTIFTHTERSVAGSRRRGGG
jgi:uncharacterized protein YlzI (FlbEa/FlbD family)